MGAKDLKQEIKRKFRNVQRFAALSRVPYYTVVRTLAHGDVADLERIEKLVKKTTDEPVPGEITEADLSAIKKALVGKPASWYPENGISRYWVKLVLAGKFRFKDNPRLTRLAKLLEIELD